jgi:hypothetical protein
VIVVVVMPPQSIAQERQPLASNKKPTRSPSRSKSLP